MLLRSSHLAGDHLFYFRATAVASVCSLCQVLVGRVQSMPGTRFPLGAHVRILGLLLGVTQTASF